MVVSELSRLGRSLGQIVAILDAFVKAGVAFVAMKENIRVEGKRDLIPMPQAFPSPRRLPARHGRPSSPPCAVNDIFDL